MNKVIFHRLMMKRGIGKSSMAALPYDKTRNQAPNAHKDYAASARQLDPMMRTRSTNSRSGSGNKNISNQKSKNVVDQIAKGIYDANLKSDKYYQAGLEGLYVGEVLFTTTMTKGGDRRRLNP
jgi:hypothetical protein